MIGVSIVGGSGYVAGDLLRLLLAHPGVEVRQVVSRSNAGRFVHSIHPNLRGRTSLKFEAREALAKVDALILALPHGEAAHSIESYAPLAERILDASADFRLRDPALYKRFYGDEPPAPNWLPRFVYGLPELHRQEIRAARYVSGVGCNATTVNLALWPLVKAGLVDPLLPVIAEVKVGSSEAGANAGESSHHPDRSGVVRSYAPVGHRHAAEIRQETGLQNVHLSITAVELVRGALATAHVFPSARLTEKDLWRLLRDTWKGEPFVRIVHEKQGNFRHPEPKLLAGTNFADVGFAVDEDPDGRPRVVALAAIDNLGKGAAGSLVQCLNLMLGFDETTALGFPGLHPI